MPPLPRGYHLITTRIRDACPQLRQIRVGIMQIFIQHTSASLTLNENADPDVRVDMESLINHIVPERFDYVHTLEGSDDMPAHMKSSLMGSSVTIPIRDGRLALGTWQGVYLCEHRNRGGGRNLVITIQGETESP